VSDDLLIDHTAYDFQLALSDSIEAYVREMRTEQFRALSYRGVDFGRAIAVNLYFRLVNDAALRAAHGRAAAGESLSEDPDVIPVSTVAYWILRQMLGRHPRLTARRLTAYVKNSLTIGSAHLRKQGRAVPSNGGVLVLALSRRFFDYLMPVRQALGSDVAWLVPAGAAWAEAMAAAGETVVPFGEEEGQKPQAPLTAALAGYGPELALRFDTFHRILERRAPRAVIMTEGNQPDDEILARAAETLGVRSICIQQGWSPVIHAGFRGMRYDDFCVWGQEFADLLQPANPHQHFAVTGSHRIDPMPAAQPGDKRAIAFFLQNNSLLITRRAWREMLELVLWTAATWPEREILVREHPASPLTAQEQRSLAARSNIILCPSATVPLDSMLRRSSIAVAFFSTTLIEALAYNTAPLIINITGAPTYVPDLAGSGAGLEVKDFDAARIQMARLCTDPGPVQARIPAILPRFFACSSAQALRNIAACAESR
jgi:hypothetical protein